MGAPTWPPYPQTLVAPRMNRGAPRSRACRMGAPTWPPYPQTLVAPRMNRGAPRSRACRMGAPTWPPYPQPLVAPRMNRGAPRSRACRMGAPTWPPYPQRSPRPGEAVPRLDLALEARGAREMERAAVGVGEAEHGRKIGRASCRERVWVEGGGGGWKRERRESGVGES